MRRTAPFFLTVFTFLIFILPARALTEGTISDSIPDLSLFTKALFIDGGDTLPYRILFPDNYDAGKKYPLVLFLHGAGERGNDNEKQLVHGASLFLKSENRRNFPCIVIFPQCPSNGFWASVKFDRSKKPDASMFDYHNKLTESMEMAMALTRRIIRSGAVDKRRVYISGLSMGGMGTFEAVGRWPKMFAAAAPICGGGDVKGYHKKTAKVPFWIFHGAADHVVPAQFSRDMYARLQAMHATVKYSEYPGVDHNSWDNAFAEPDFLSWMFSQKR